MIGGAPHHRRPPVESWGIWVALAICGLFFALQLGALDYGTTINNLPHIARYQIKNAGSASSAINRRNLILDETTYEESLDKQMLRFKLYSVEADEVLNIISLARMKPAELRIDPGLYQYGGAYLYPLAAWLFVLAKTDVVQIGPLADMLAHPDRMDGVYIFGRLFVLIATTLSGLVLFLAARRLVPAGAACLVLGLYLAAPATVMFSQIMKPHWYALLWVNLAILMVLRMYQDRRFGWGASMLTGITLGLAVGSAQTYGLFAGCIWLALALGVRRGILSWTHLVLVPLIAFAAFAVTNPYVVLAWKTFLAERELAATTWFAFETHPKFVAQFIWGSLLPGLGIGLAVLLLGCAVFRVVKGKPLERWVAVGLIVAVIFVGYLNASLSQWHINLRYAPWLLSVGVLFVGAGLAQRRELWLGLCIVLSVLQSVPLWLAYRDEDSARHSTRLRAARWIETRIPAGTAIEVGTRQPAPYEVPPFDLSRYRIGARDWQYQVRMEREPDHVEIPAGTRLVARFTPRLTIDYFPLVYSHINPQISIYRRDQ